MVAQESSFLRDKAYIAVALSHFFVDVLNNSRTLLVALLAVSIGLSNAQVGIALLLYNVGSALAQPLFGALADRSGPRWLVVGGIGWMIALYGVASIAGDWIALIALTLAGLGSGAVHPAGTKVASESSRQARTQATAVFFTAGQLGLFFGPILAGFALEALGRPGFLVLPTLAMLALASGWRWVENDLHRPEVAWPLQPKAARSEDSAQRRIPWRTVIPLAIIIVASSTIGIAAINFAPKLFTELGYSPSYIGWTAGLYMLGSAGGGIIGGRLGDRLGRRPPIFLGMSGAILPLYFYIPAPDFWRLLLLPLAGFFAGMPHSVLVISAQRLLPGRRALASGLILGLMFFGGAIGSYIVGLVADRIGLATALQGTVLLPVVALVAMIVLPAADQAARPAPEHPRPPTVSRGSQL
ncbi:MAG: MFS transporter [Candidatus Promineifilaceae bacterium]|nr:MFS transporter [Candidatus Promineifilaceae bacterium]